MSFFARWMRSYAVPTEGLAVFRIVFAAHALLLGLPAFGWAGALPAAFYHPPRYSLGAFLESAPSALALNVLSVAAVALLIALLFGYRTRAVSLLLAAVVTVGLTFVYSYGKIKHQYVFFAAVPLVLAFSPWGAAFSVDAARRGAAPARMDWSNAWPVALAALLIGFGYFSAGLPKLLVWVDFDLATQGARSWLAGRVQPGQEGSASFWFFHNAHPLLWEAMDYTAVFFEVGFLLAILNVHVFRAFIVAAIVFHAANVLVMSIDFTHLAFVYVLFLPWRRVLAGSWGPRLASAARVFGSGRLFVALLVVGSGLAALALSSQPEYVSLLGSLLGFVLPDSYVKLLLFLVQVSFGGARRCCPPRLARRRSARPPLAARAGG